jgi:hypothetical protein
MDNGGNMNMNGRDYEDEDFDGNMGDGMGYQPDMGDDKNDGN